MCATILALIFLAASCGGAESGGDSSAPSFEIPGSGGNAGGGSAGNGGNKDDSQDNDNPTNNPKDEPSDTNVQSILKDILGEDYDSLSGKLSSNITLTAQTIVDVTDIFPVLTAAVTDSNKENEVRNKLSDKGDDVKVALIAEVEKKLTISKANIERKGKPYIINESSIIYSGSTTLNSNDYTISTTLTKVLLSGKFDIDTIYIKSLNGPIEFNNDFKLVSETYILEKNKAMFISELKNMYDNLKLSSKTVDKLPELDLVVYVEDCEGLKQFLEIYNKYNSSDKMQIAGNFSNVEFDGSKLVSNSSGYTLFSNNTAKSSNDSSIKSIAADELVKLSNKYGIKKIKNIIVSGAAAANSVNWTNLTNVIFEGNMSQLTINNQTNLNGIVYFKDLPYKNSNNSHVTGSLKLNKIANTMAVSGDGNGKTSFVLDLSSISNFYNNYSSTNLMQSSIINAVYFNEDQESYKDKDDKGFALYEKIVDSQAGKINNVYFGGIRATTNGFKLNQGVKTSDKARTLEEFEYLGNNGTYPDGGTVA